MRIMGYLPHLAIALLSAYCLPLYAAATDALAPCVARDLGFDRAEAGWKPQPISKLKRDKKSEDAPLRVIVAFDGDKSTLPADDYRRAFGSGPGKLLGVGVMTDTDNTGKKAVGLYAGIRLECGGK